MINRLWFFFSSRRRHTRLQGDWSSDVCSSDLRLLGVGWKGLHDGQLLEDGEDDFVGGSKRCFDAGAPELQQGIVFVKMPRQAGAKGDDTLETRVRLGPVRFRPREFFNRQMRIENELDAAIIFAREFADHE